MIRALEGRMSREVMFSSLWLFAMLNYLYCDILGLFDAEVLRELLTGSVGGLEMTPVFLLGASVLMEIPIAMVLLSRILPHGPNRWANGIAGVIMTVVQIASLSVGDVAVYYLFFSIIEVATTVLIVILAVRWRPGAAASGGEILPGAAGIHA